ncbi:hypothetical protein TNCT_352271 [Trichonephila clavata]|uniref:Transmembrane protein n=1 Tax=Trichonephila clavata TaxID=2740835 RepID=A0A8X6JCC1_TRICU|nr:hypothetical protein TNCT_352271 [Trichonephila clavata]
MLKNLQFESYRRNTPSIWKRIVSIETILYVRIPHLRLLLCGSVTVYVLVGAYLIGLGLGHYLWKRELCKKERNNMITLCCGWIGFAICVWICFNVLYFSKETLLKRIAFNGVSDFFFSCGVAWIIYVCATKQGGV